MDDSKRGAAVGSVVGSMVRSGSKAEVEMPEDEKPKPRRKTVMRLMAQGERADRKSAAEKKAKDDDQPLCKLVPMDTAIQLKGITTALARQLPQGMAEIRMSRLRAPTSSTGAVLRDGATVDQAATHAALKALEQWVRILRPFASSDDLAGLISRIVHVKDDGSWNEREDTPLEVIPPANELLGAAIRRIVPDPQALEFTRWEWIEDLLRALSYEELFDHTSFVHRSSSPSGTMRQTGETLVSTTARPKTTGRIPAKRPQSEAARMRLSGDFPWASFKNNCGFRATSFGTQDERYTRGLPGPAMYGDYDKKLAKPQNAAIGIFPSIGDRRTPCIATPLAQLDRFFQQDFRLE